MLMSHWLKSFALTRRPRRYSKQTDRRAGYWKRRTIDIITIERLEDRTLLSELVYSAAADMAADTEANGHHEELVFPNGWLGDFYAAPLADSGHEADPLTIILDFNDPAQPPTTDGMGNMVGTFDVTAYGFAAGDFNLVTNAILDKVREHYFTIPTSEVNPLSPLPPGMDLALEFVIGDFGSPPSNGATEYYYVQIGSVLTGSSLLGQAHVNAIRDPFGSPGAAVGSVIGSVFTDNIQGLTGLTPSNALSSGNLNFTVNAIAGTTSHEAGHALSLRHLNKAGAITPNGLPPIMGTGAVDLPNQDRILNREFSISGQNMEAGGATQNHIQQLITAVGLHHSEDLGDAPDSYGTLRGSDGARHIATGPTLGMNRDTDANGQPTPGADGDDLGGIDDEDGFVSQSAFAPGEAGTIAVDVQGTAGSHFINAWIDFNNNGVFTDAGEQIATDFVVNSDGSHFLNFSVPASAVVGDQMLRIRLDSGGGLGPTGRADDGEVEDHLVTISMASTIYVDSNWIGTTIGTDPDGAGPATMFGTDSFATIQEGLDAAPIAGTVLVFPGTGPYMENVTINDRLTLSGSTGTAGDVVIAANGGVHGIVIDTDANVRIQDLRVIGALSEGIRSTTAGLDLTLDNVESINNGRHGVFVQNSNSLLIDGGSYSNNDSNADAFGDGIHAEGITFFVTLQGNVTATANVRGVFVNGAATYSDFSTNASSNSSHGVLLAGITGAASLTGSMLQNNAANGFDIANTSAVTLSDLVMTANLGLGGNLVNVPVLNFSSTSSGGNTVDMVAINETPNRIEHTRSGVPQNAIQYDANLASLSVMTADGDDQVQLQSGGGLPMSVDIDGGAGNNELIGPDASQTWTLTGVNSGNIGGPGTIDFSNMPNLTGRTGDDVFAYTTGATTGTIDGGLGLNSIDNKLAPGSRTINLETTSGTGIADFTNIDSLLAGGADDVLIGPNAVNTWNLTGNTPFQGSTGVNDVVGQVDFIGFFQLLGGNNDDTFQFLGPDIAVAGGTLIDGGAHSAGDTLDFSAVNSGLDINLQTSTFFLGFVNLSNLETLIGGGGDDTLIGTTGDDDITINGTDDGQFVTPSLQIYDFIDFAVLDGGMGDDTFRLTDSGSVSGQIIGGGPASVPGDTLDFTAVSAPVTVDLQTNTADGVTSFTGIEIFAGNSGTLIGENNVQMWTVDGANDGTVPNDGVSSRFLDFAHLIGGTSSDTFAFIDGGAITGTIDGENPAAGPGDILDFSNLTSAVTVDAASQSAMIGGLPILGSYSDIESVIGDGIDDIVQGPNSPNAWLIDGTLDDGVNDFMLNGVPYQNFPNLVGGNNNDTFIWNGSGVITGTVDGRGGVDRLDFSTLSKVHVQLNNLGAVDGFAGGEVSAASVLAAFTNIDTLTGGNGTTDVLRGRNASAVWNLNGGNETYVSGNTLDFSGFEDYRGGTQDDTFHVTPPLNAGVPIRLDGWTGSDTFNVNFNTLQAVVVVDDTGGSGIDALNMFATNAVDILLLNAGSVQRTNGPLEMVNYSGIEDLTVDAMDGNDIITIDGTQTTVLGGMGDDVFSVDSTGPGGLTLDGQAGSDDYIVELGDTAGGTLQGAVTIADSGTGENDEVTVIGGMGDDTLGVSATGITRGIDSVGIDEEIEAATIVGGSGRDTFIVTPSADTQLHIDGEAPASIPGDTLNLITPPGESSTFLPGGPGSGTFATTGAFLDVDFEDIESITLGGNVVVNGTAGKDTLELTANGPDSGTLSLNGGPAMALNGMTALMFNGFGGDDVFRLIQSPGLLRPEGGIFFDGGAGDDLIELQGASPNVIYDFDDKTSGSIAFQDDVLFEQFHAAIRSRIPIETVVQADTSRLQYKNVEPITDTMAVSTRAFIYNTSDEDITLTDLAAGTAQISSVDGNGAATSETVTFSLMTGNSVMVFGDGGDDELRATSANVLNSIDLSLFGGDGRDTLRGSAGSDTLSGGDGLDSLIGGNGIDTVWESANSNFTLANSLVSFTGENGQSANSSLVSIEHAHLTGGFSNDILNASAFTLGRVTLNGGVGNDTLTGTAFGDILNGDNGDDLLNGGTGSDTLDGGDDNDTVNGGDGNDLLSGGNGNDVVSGGNGNDTLGRGTGNDQLFGGPGIDQVLAESEHLAPAGPINIEITSGGVLTIAGGGSIAATRYTLLNLETALISAGPDPATAAAINIINIAHWNEIATVTVFGSDRDDTIRGGDNTDLLQGNAGNDRVFGRGASDTIDGGEGDDFIRGGGGADHIDGGAGSDHIFGQGGDDVITGSEGENTIAGGGGNDTITGGADNDTLNGNGGIDIIHSGGSATGDSIHGGGAADSIIGSEEDDTIFGANGPDTIRGGLGGDSIHSGAGADWLLGEGGADTIRSGNGPDTIEGGDENDMLFGQRGNDFILGGDGDDLLSGADGKDTLLGEQGNDDLIGGNLSDYLDGGNGADILHGGDDADTLVSGSDTSPDTLDGGTGGNDNDVLFINTDDHFDLTDTQLIRDPDALSVGPIVDSLSNIDAVLFDASNSGGGKIFDAYTAGIATNTIFSGTATLIGSSGPDTFIGGLGDDNILGGGGADSLEGNGGDDTVVAGNGAGNTIHGGNGRDSLIGGNAADTIFGGSGTDYIDGGAGNDHLNGNGETDTIFGGDGDDVISGDGDADSLDGGKGHDVLLGGVGSDTLTGNSGDDTIDGGDGIDLLYEQSSQHLILSDTELRVSNNTSTDDLANMETALLVGDDDDNSFDASGFSGSVTLIGNEGDDTLRGTNSDDLFDGGDGDDTIDARAGADLIFGGNGHDTIDAGNGDDIVDAGGDNDHVDAGEGADSVFGGGGGDTIRVGDGGADTVRGGNGADSIISTGNSPIPGALDDRLYGESGNDTIDGGDGNDSLSGGTGEDLIFGGAATPGNDGGDIIFGGDGADTLIGGSGNDMLIGGGGNDTLDGETGQDTVDGGDGSNTIVPDPFVPDHTFPIDTDNDGIDDQDLNMFIAQQLQLPPLGWLDEA